MLQELKGTIEALDVNADDLPKIPRSSEWSFNIHTNNDLPDCYVSVKRKGPATVASQEYYPEGQNIVAISKKRVLLWMMLRFMCSESSQTFPG